MDLLRIIELTNSGQQTFENNFLDPAFTASWEFQLRENDIYIRASWFAITPVAHKNEAINDIDSVPDAFIVQLRLLINNVNSDLFTAGYPKKLQSFKYNN